MIRNIVTIGGGTGSFTLLSGLKNIPNINITALVSMADDGGSTGVLRDELGVLPAGDVRQCLVALSEHTEVVRKLMNYRFDSGGLSGHSFGNIFLAALEKVTGSFSEGVEVVSEILKIKGRVVPITGDPAELSVELQNGKIVKGENNIQNAALQKYGLRKIFYKKNVKLSDNARKAILEADYIILGPGNYYCSVIPNLVVDGFKDAMEKTKAKIIFPINLTNKIEHTENWKVSTYVDDVRKYLGKKVDIILVNNKMPNIEQIKLYEIEGRGVLVKDDLKDRRVFRTPLLSHIIYKTQYDEKMQATRGFIRHDPNKLAKSIERIINKK